MKKEISFFILFVLLISGAANCYISFSNYFKGSEINKKYLSQLEKQVKYLQAQNRNVILEHGKPLRSLASLPKKEILMDKVYLESLKHLIQSNSSEGSQNYSQLVELSKKVISTSPDSQVLAETYYHLAEVNCQKLKKEEECLKNIENLVSQFPDSNWTGKSMVLLTHLYIKLNRKSEALALLNVIKSEFSSDQQLVLKVKEVEKELL